jgi:chromosomal replication initiation ATPase DnaA
MTAKPLTARGYPYPQAAREIIAQTARDHHTTVERLLSKDRTTWVVHARFDAMWRLRTIRRPHGLPRYTQPHIAFLLGLSDHTTVTNGLRRWPVIVASLSDAKREAEAA